MDRKLIQSGGALIIYDGECRFCRSQIAILNRLDMWGVLTFESLHDPSIHIDFPDITHEELLKRMYVIDSDQSRYSGANAIRYLSRKLMLLWPLAILLHIPYSMWLWNMVYNFIARNRYRIAGKCTGSCKIKK